MAARKNNKKKNKAVSSGRLKGILSFLLPALFGAVIALAGVFVYFAMQPEEASVEMATGKSAGNGPAITYEETGEHVEPVVVDKPPVKEPKAGKTAGSKPRIAIVIDDMGYQQKTCNGLLDLDLKLSFAFLPYGPYTRKQADKAHRLGRDVLLHFPMEAAGSSWDPGPGKITIDMGSRSIEYIFTENLAAVPHVRGVNNHMGSRFTQNRQGMEAFMDQVRSSGLFFLDSRTSQNSLGVAVAREKGVRTARRNVFLDNVRKRREIKVQLGKLLDIAERHGSAIAIGHPYPETLQALRDMRREIGDRARLVGVSELVR